MLTLSLVSTPYTLLTLSGASHINIKFLLPDSFSNTLKQLNEIGKTYLNEELQYLADNQLFLEKINSPTPPQYERLKYLHVIFTGTQSLTFVLG